MTKPKSKTREEIRAEILAKTGARVINVIFEPDDVGDQDDETPAKRVSASKMEANDK